MRREKPVPSVFSRRLFLFPPLPSAPRHASFFPQFLRENGLKDFRLRFVAAFVPLRSFSSPLRAGLPPPLFGIAKKTLIPPPRSFSFLRTLYLTFVSDSLFPEPRRCSIRISPISRVTVSFSFAWDCERNCIPAKFTPDCNVAINSVTGFRTARFKDEFPNSSTLS